MYWTKASNIYIYSAQKKTVQPFSFWHCCYVSINNSNVTKVDTVAFSGRIFKATDNKILLSVSLYFIYVELLAKKKSVELNGYNLLNASD